MKEVRIKLDYMNGPVWKDQVDPSSGRLTTGVSVVDGDVVIEALDEKASAMYSSLYSFDEYGKGCSFDQSGYEGLREKIFRLVKAIISRLAEINDGSFVVVDEASAELREVPRKIG